MRKKEERKNNPQNTRPKQHLSHSPGPQEFPLISKVIKSVPSKLLQEEDFSDTLSEDKFLLNTQPQEEQKNGQVSGEKDRKSERDEHSPPEDIQQERDKDQSQQSQKKEGSRDSKPIITYSQLPLLNKEERERKHVSGREETKNLERKRISSSRKNREQKASLPPIEEVLDQVSKIREETKAVSTENRGVGEIRKQNEQIIGLLSEISGGVKEIIKMQGERAEERGRELKEIKTLLAQALSSRSQSAPPLQRKEEDHYANIVKSTVIESKTDDQKNEKEPTSSITLQRKEKEEEEEEAFDLLLLQSSLGKEPELKFNRPKEQAGFTSAATNNKININKENLAQAEKFYERMDRNGRGSQKNRETEEDEEFFALLKKAKQNKRQASFKPVKRTTTQRDMSGLENSERRKKGEEKTRKFKVPYREIKNTQEATNQKPIRKKEEEKKSHSRGSIPSSQKSQQGSQRSKQERKEDEGASQYSRAEREEDEEDSKEAPLSLQFSDFKHLNEVEPYVLKKKRKLKVNYAYYPVRCPCTEYSAPSKICQLCGSEEELDIYALVNFAKSLERFEGMNTKWVAMKAPLITQRLQNQRKTPYIKVEKFLGSLKQFHSLEFYHHKVSFIRRALEKDISPQCRVVLQVVGILEIITKKGERRHQLVLYDGQYTIHSQVFEDNSANSIALEELVRQRKLELGTKLVVWNAEFRTNNKRSSQEAPRSEEIEEMLYLLQNSELELKFNSIRKAEQSLGLGCSIPENKLFTTSISSALPNCGRVPVFRGAIIKRYPLVFLNFSYGKQTQRWKSTECHRLNFERLSEEEGEEMRPSKLKTDNSEKKPFTKPTMKALVMQLSYLKERRPDMPNLFQRDLRNSALIEFSGPADRLEEYLTPKTVITLLNIQPVSYHPFRRAEGLLFFQVNLTDGTPIGIEEAPSPLKKEIEEEGFFRVECELEELLFRLQENHSISGSLGLKHFNNHVRQNPEASLLLELAEVSGLFLILIREVVTLDEGRGQHLASVFALDSHFNLVELVFHSPVFFSTSTFPKEHAKVFFTNLKYQGPHREEKEISVLKTTRDSDFTERLSKQQKEEAKSFNRLYSKTKEFEKMDDDQFEELKEKVGRLARVPGSRGVKLPLTSPKPRKKA